MIKFTIIHLNGHKEIFDNEDATNTCLTSMERTNRDFAKVEYKHGDFTVGTIFANEFVEQLEANGWVNFNS